MGRLFTRLFTRLLLCLSIGGPSSASAQDAFQNSSRNFWDLSAHAGSLLPSVRFVREIVPGWGLRAATSTSRGTFELETFHGRGNGIVYHSVSLDYRLDLLGDILPVHFVIGGHMDFYQAPRVPDLTPAGGWHFGGGLLQPIIGPLAMRFDFKYRFSPGQSVYVGVGFLYRLPGTGTN